MNGIATDDDIEITSFRIKGTRVHAAGPGRHGTSKDSWHVYSPKSEDGQHVRVEHPGDLASAVNLARQRGAEDAPVYAAYEASWRQPVEPYTPPPAAPTHCACCLNTGVIKGTGEYETDTPCPYGCGS